MAPRASPSPSSVTRPPRRSMALGARRPTPMAGTIPMSRWATHAPIHCPGSLPALARLVIPFRARAPVSRAARSFATRTTTSITIPLETRTPRSSAPPVKYGWADRCPPSHRAPQASAGSRATAPLQRCKTQTRGANTRVAPITTKRPVSRSCLSGSLRIVGLRPTFAFSRPRCRGVWRRGIALVLPHVA